MELDSIDDDNLGEVESFGTLGDGYDWPGGVIPYVIDPSVHDPDRVLAAIAKWQNAAYVFQPRIRESAYIRFIDDGRDRCWSFVGSIGYRQNLAIGRCSIGQLAHELGHAIGLKNEEQRLDRDQYVVVHPECIGDDHEELGIGYYGTFSSGPYDYGSIMQDGRRAYSNGCETITPLLPNTFIGQRAMPSAGDILATYHLRWWRRPNVTFYVADHDGDGIPDLGAKDDTGTWRIDYGNNGYGVWDVELRGYGGPEALPVPADYDGDGRADLAVKTDDGHWLIDRASTGFGTWDWSFAHYGNNSAVPVPADYDGDGRADLAIKGPDGAWFIDWSSDGFGAWNQMLWGYGDANARPIPADYDGDGKADLAILGPDGAFLVDFASDGFGVWNLMRATQPVPGAVPAIGDYDNDRCADLAVKGSDGSWKIDYCKGGFGWWDVTLDSRGTQNSLPLVADFDRDGNADVAVKETDGAGVFYLDGSRDGFGNWNFYTAFGM